VNVALNAAFGIAVLAVSASGLAVIFGLMRVINFAHGELIMLGAFVAVWTASFGQFWLSLLLAPLLVGAGSLAIERGLIRRLYSRPLETILATIGLSLVIREAMKLAVGPQFRSLESPRRGSTHLLGLEYPTYRLIVMAIAAGLLLTLVLLVRFTRFGLLVRAVIQNRDLAAGLGVNVSGTYMLAFATGSALAGFAGAVLAPLVTIHPEMGPDFLVGSFLTVILAGSSPASLAGSAALLGGTQSLVGRYWDATAGTIALLLVAVLVLRMRSYGRGSG